MATLCIPISLSLQDPIVFIEREELTVSLSLSHSPTGDVPPAETVRP